MSAEERRESVVDAAVTEFARGGYQGTSTEAIAQRVGVSQPYLFRLFPNKRAIFLAASVRCAAKLREAFVDAAEKVPPAERKDALGVAYMQLIADTDLVMMQMQMQVAVYQTALTSDPEFGETIRRAWTGVFDTVRLLLPEDEAAAFMAEGMLINAMTALSYPPGHRLWTCALPP